MNVLDDKGGNVSSSVVWAFRDAEKNEGIKITFTNQGNPLGGRSRFPERGIVFINGYDLSEDFKENALGGAPNALAYISMLAHEFWHATMQPAGTANNPAGEQMAFIVQKEVLKELGGAQGNLDFLQEIIDNPAAYGYLWNPKILLQTCLALTFDNPFTSPYMPDRNVLRRLEEFPGQ